MIKRQAACFSFFFTFSLSVSFCYSPRSNGTFTIAMYDFTSFLQAGMAMRNGDFKWTKFLFNSKLLKETFLLTAIIALFAKKTSRCYFIRNSSRRVVMFGLMAFVCSSMPSPQQNSESIHHRALFQYIYTKTSSQACWLRFYIIFEFASLFWLNFFLFFFLLWCIIAHCPVCLLLFCLKWLSVKQQLKHFFS